MKGEVPEFRRCCFCLPLRYGLLAWGYFKMTADAFLVALSTCILINTIMMMQLFAKDEEYKDWVYKDLAVSVFALVVFFTDFVLTIVFIVGGHKKNVRLMRVFYNLSLGMWVITFLLFSITIVKSIYRLMTHNIHTWGLGSVLGLLCFYFLVLAVQTYFLLLLRSEIIKLRNNGEFRFVNHAAEAECTMNCEEILVGAETEKQDK